MSWILRANGRRPRVALALLFALTLVSASASAVRAGTCHFDVRPADATLELISDLHVRESYAIAVRLLLEGIVGNRLVNLGFTPSSDDKRVAQAFLAHLKQPPPTLTGGSVGAQPNELDWPAVGLKIAHPVTWYTPPADVHRMCTTTFAALSCNQRTGAQRAAWVFASQLFDNAGRCSTLPGRSRADVSELPGNLRPFYKLFGSPTRYSEQYSYLSRFSNRPFQRSETLYKILYADFFRQSLKSGTVREFSLEYFSKGNPLSAHKMHQPLLQVTRVLVDNGLLN